MNNNSANKSTTSETETFFDRHGSHKGEFFTGALLVLGAAATATNEPRTPPWGVDRAIETEKHSQGQLPNDSTLATIGTPKSFPRAGMLAPLTPTDDIVDSLIAEKNSLVNMKFQGDLTPDRERQLNFLLWRLDQIETIKAESSLSRLDKAVEAHEQFGRRVRDWVQEVRQLVTKNQKPRTVRSKKQRGR